MNVQNHVIIIASEKGLSCIVGTNTKRGFTEAGAEKAVEKLREKLPASLIVCSMELTPINSVLASLR